MGRSPSDPWAPPVLSKQIDTHHRGWWLSNLIALDMLANTLVGGRVADTISARMGRSMAHGGWAADLHWPRWWVKHCYWAAGYEPPPRSVDAA